MSSLFGAFVDLLFPPICLCCDRQLDNSRPPLFCPLCLDEVACVTSPCCFCCGTPFPGGSDHFCGFCLQDHYHFDRARSVFYYKQPLSSLILSLKFDGQMVALPSLVSLVSSSRIIEEFTPPDLLLPVPLYITRLRQRGFNQALLLARNCFPQWKNRVEPNLLQRSRATISQSLLTGVERRKNLKKAFVVAHPEKISGKRVLLVDDVFTTGTTVDECARVLRLAGAARIEVFTLARAM